MYLCCDLGGTTTEWGIYDSSGERFVLRFSKETKRYEDFYHMLDESLADCAVHLGKSERITNSTLGVAGPTNQRIVRITNIAGWEVDVIEVNNLLEEYGHRPHCSVINDFEALGYGLLHLNASGFAEDDFEQIHGTLPIKPPRVENKRKQRSLVCGPGTGLGVACIVNNLERDGYPFIFSSEGGHHTLSPESDNQFRLLTNRSGNFEPRSYEELLSKKGLSYIYNFFRREDHKAEENWGVTSDEIISFAKSGKDHAAIDTIQLFSELLANFCGNVALTMNIDKAIFLWGGTLRDIPVDLLKSRFDEFYWRRRRQHADRIKRVPVVLLRNEDVPLLGCARRSEYEMRHSST